MITSLIFLSTILSLVVYLTRSRRDLIAVPEANGRPARRPAVGESRVLVVTNKANAPPAVLEAMRERAAAGPASFFVLVPNPDHLAVEDDSRVTPAGEQVLARALPPMTEPAGGEVRGRVASGPTPYEDIVEELQTGHYREIILETLPSHVSHWLHVDLPHRLAQLGYPLTTVPATQ